MEAAVMEWLVWIVAGWLGVNIAISAVAVALGRERPMDRAELDKAA
jgi:hypothetical protein